MQVAAYGHTYANVNTLITAGTAPNIPLQDARSVAICPKREGSLLVVVVRALGKISAETTKSTVGLREFRPANVLNVVRRLRRKQ